MKNFLLFLSFFLLSFRYLFAQCIPPQEEGNWSNIDPNTRSFTHLNVHYICQDQVLNGEPCCPIGPPYYVHLFGSCSPTDCDWGQSGGNRIGNGYLYFFYDQGFAKRHVFVRMSQRYPGKLYLQVQTDFTDPNRADYVSDEWFNKTALIKPVKGLVFKPFIKNTSEKDSLNLLTFHDRKMSTLKSAFEIKSNSPVKFHEEPNNPKKK